MQAVLLAFEPKTQLAPLSESVALSLMPVANRPLLVYTIERLARVGIEQIHIDLSHLSGEMRAYFGDGRRWNVNLNYIEQSKHSVAGLLKDCFKAEEDAKRPVLVLPNNQIVDFDIEEALKFHQAHGGIATNICSAPAASLSATGDYPIARSTSAFIFEPKVLSYVTGEEAFNCKTDLLAALYASREYIGEYKNNRYWNPLASLAHYQQAQADFMWGGCANAQSEMVESAANELGKLQRNLPQHVYIEGRHVSNGIWCGAGSIIHPNARLTAPVVIGANCVVGRDVELGPNVVIGKNSVVDIGASIAESTILPNTYIGKLLNVRRRVVDRDLLIDVENEQCARIADKFMLTEIAPPPTQGVLFRLIERLIALIALIALSPLIAVIVFVMVLQGNKQIFTRVTRVGKRPSVHLGKQQAAYSLVRLWRFYTRDKAGNDVGMGERLEQYSLDRLPELWNVVVGEIGLIGVEPLPSDLAMQPMDDWQARRFRYQMGFTGPWFTHRPADASSDSRAIRYAAEIHYMANRTWHSDLHQLWWTPAGWLRRARSWSPAHYARPKDLTHVTPHQP